MTHARGPDRERTVRHYASHADLLRPARPGQFALDAVVVPAARPASNLESALRLGADLDVPVVALCSRDTKVAEVLDRADGIGGARCTAVAIPGRVDGLPPLRTSAFAEAPIPWHGDLSLKRNLGLVLGRLCGWRTLVFLDDDIRGVTPALVRRAVGTLHQHAAAGMPATAFPDNSMVGYARRLAFDDQGVFVSGSALAVDLRRVESFFPEIYNEDWLFLAPYLDRREVATVGSVRQDHRDPFEKPERARAEEFGDVVGEGLVGWLHGGSLHGGSLHGGSLHGGSLHSILSPDYWAGFLRLRSELLATIAFGCLVSDHPDALRAQVALTLAEEARADLSAAVLADYVSAWRADRASWRRYLARLAPRDHLPRALEVLGLEATSIGAAYTTPRTGSD